VLVEAIERAASLEPEAVRRALERTDLSTFFGPVRFDAAGRNTPKPMLLQQLQGGRYKVVWPREVAWTRLVHPIPSWEDRR
jgi:branched-chain amino acid transport system substrate-binding protein